MRLRRDILIVGGLFLILAAFLVLVPADSSEADLGASSHSSRPEGTLALYRWLGDLGYQVERLEYRDFDVSQGAELLFVLAPPDSYTPEAVQSVLTWVEAGGTLILADDRRTGGAAALLHELGISVATSPNAALTQVLLAQPVAPATTITAQTRLVLAELPAEAAPLIGDAAAPVLAGIQRGAGYVYVSSALRPFTNVGLADTGSPALVLSLLRRTSPGGRLLFDEYHHGYVGEPSLGRLLLGSPWGWALTYAGLVSAAYIVLSGRRFGRPTSLPEETSRRSSAEYLESMAGLLRRGRQSGYLLQHYRVSLKRRLAKPYGISPALDDDAFVATLASARPINPVALRSLLARMDRPVASEAEILKIIAEADRL